jgi:hypothetical protein
MGPKKICGRRHATQGLTRPMTPSHHQTFAAAHRTAIAPAAHSPGSLAPPSTIRRCCGSTVLSDGALRLGLKASAAKHHANHVPPALPRRLRLLPSAAAVSTFTKSLQTMRPAPAMHSSPAVPAPAVPTSSISSQSLRRGALSTPGGRRYPEGFILRRPCPALDGSSLSHRYLEVTPRTLQRHMHRVDFRIISGATIKWS